MLNSNFLEPGDLRDGDLKLVCTKLGEPDEEKGLVPWYEFSMKHVHSGEELGIITLRLGQTPHLVLYGGQIGYKVERPFRGHRFASRSIRLLLPLAKAHELNPLWITCSPDNLASRRTCELAGGVLEEIAQLPEGIDLYERGEREVCRFRFDLEE